LAYFKVISKKFQVFITCYSLIGQPAIQISLKTADNISHTPVSIKNTASCSNGQPVLSHPAQLKRRATRINLEKRAFWTMMALAAIVTLFWFPADIYYFMLSSRPANYSPVFESVQLILSYTVTVLNPLFYHALNHDVRRAVKKVLTSLCCF
jgi:hypothetical protein